MKLFRLVAILLGLHACSFTYLPAKDDTEALVVVGGSAAGVAAAIAAKRAGADHVVITEALPVVGGRMAETLGFGEEQFMKTETLGGIWIELQERVKRFYGKEVRTPEPHVMQEIFRSWLDELGVEVLTGFVPTAVSKEGTRIVSVESEDKRRTAGKCFIDATYAGDLLPLAGITWNLGRESRTTYGESLAGVILELEDPPGKVVIDIHRSPISGFAKDGKTLLPHVQGLTTDVTPGSGDTHLQCFNLYACLTMNPELRIELQEPDGYDATEFELLRREILRNGNRVPFRIGGGVPNGKAKINDGVGILLHWGLAGGGDRFPTAQAAEREKIRKTHRDYTHELLWFLQNDPSIDRDQREEFRRWGLPKDEFAENGHWPWDVYVREGRRMKGQLVLTQRDLFDDVKKTDSIALGSFPVDSHVVQRLASPDGAYVVNEGGYLVEPPIYQIPYRSLLPKAEECTNLLAPVAMSCSRVAFNSLRVEPTWMTTGQASGIAAALALEHHDGDTHAVDTKNLQELLRREGVPVDLP